MLHETGHAIYEFGIRDDLTQTLVGQGTSMGMHECQSRFFENIVGRSMHSGNRFMEKWRRCLEAADGDESGGFSGGG